MFKIVCFIFLFSSLLCTAQSPILPLKNPGAYLDNAYYKDLDNELNKYADTWIYKNEETLLTLTFLKKEKVFMGSWYEDILIGEYKYIEDGMEILNYLPRLTDSNINDAQHYINFSWFIKKLEHPSCYECPVSERRLLMSFTDPALDRKKLKTSMVLRHITDNGVEKLQMHLDAASSSSILPDNVPIQTRVPYGEYILIKQ